MLTLASGQSEAQSQSLLPAMAGTVYSEASQSSVVGNPSAPKFQYGASSPLKSIWLRNVDSVEPVLSCTVLACTTFLKVGQRPLP